MKLNRTTSPKARPASAIYLATGASEPLVDAQEDTNHPYEMEGGPPVPAVRGPDQSGRDGP